MHDILIASAALTALHDPVQTKAQFPEPKTIAGVLAADDDWLVAEQRGDVAALNRRLSSHYRDIEADGAVHLKSELIKMTANRQVRATGPAAEIAANFRLAHPVRMDVLIAGTTAIVSFHPASAEDSSRVTSIDVFSYEHGLWRGILSKHSSRPQPKS